MNFRNQAGVITLFISIDCRTYGTISSWRFPSCAIWRSVQVLWWSEHFLAARWAFSDRNPMTLDSSEKKTHPNSAPQVLHIFISKCPLPRHRMTHSNSRNSSFLRSRCKDLLCFLNSSLELKESEESGESLHLYVFLMTCWQSPKGSPSQTTYCHSLSPSLEYCRVPACTPICLRMVLAEL